MITLKLWVENQAGDCDCTANYVEAAEWDAPAGVTLDVDGAMLSGEPEAAWAAYRSLAAAVAAAGHGDDEVDADFGEPVLTACPVELIESGYVGAAEALARLESPRRETWADFVAAVPSLRAAAA